MTANSERYTKIIESSKKTFKAQFVFIDTVILSEGTSKALAEQRAAAGKCVRHSHPTSSFSGSCSCIPLGFVPSGVPSALGSGQPDPMTLPTDYRLRLWRSGTRGQSSAR